MPTKPPTLSRKLTIENLVKEITRRDNAKGKGYDLRANHVSAVLKHLFDIFMETDVKNAKREKGKGKMAFWVASPSFVFYCDQLTARAKKGEKK